MRIRYKNSTDWDMKKIEETYFLQEKKPGKRKKYLLIPFIFLFFLIAFFIFSHHYRIILIPHLKKPKRSLLTTKFLKSIKLINSEGKIKFSQGVIYLPLFYKKPQGLILNVKETVDLEKNYLSLHLNFLENIPSKLKITCIVRDDQFYSNALNPLKVKINTTDPNKQTVLLNFKNISSLVNLSRIKQIRLTFYNLKNEPLSLLIEDIKLKGKEVE